MHQRAGIELQRCLPPERPASAILSSSQAGSDSVDRAAISLLEGQASWSRLIALRLWRTCGREEQRSSELWPGVEYETSESSALSREGKQSLTATSTSLSILSPVAARST